MAYPLVETILTLPAEPTDLNREIDGLSGKWLKRVEDMAGFVRSHFENLDHNNKKKAIVVITPADRFFLDGKPRTLFSKMIKELGLDLLRTRVSDAEKIHYTNLKGDRFWTLIGSDNENLKLAKANIIAHGDNTAGFSTGVQEIGASGDGGVDGGSDEVNEVSNYDNIVNHINDIKDDLSSDDSKCLIFGPHTDFQLSDVEKVKLGAFLHEMNFHFLFLDATEQEKIEEQNQSVAKASFLYISNSMSTCNTEAELRNETRPKKSRKLTPLSDSTNRQQGKN